MLFKSFAPRNQPMWGARTAQVDTPGTEEPAAGFANVNGPAAFRAPSWLPRPLGKYEELLLPSRTERDGHLKGRGQGV